MNDSPTGAARHVSSPATVLRADKLVIVGVSTMLAQKVLRLPLNGQMRCTADARRRPIDQALLRPCSYLGHLVVEDSITFGEGGTQPAVNDGFEVLDILCRPVAAGSNLANQVE